MKEGYEPVQPSESLEVESGKAQGVDSAEEGAYTKPWAAWKLILALAVCSVAIAGASTALYVMSLPDEAAAARASGAKKIGAGLLLCSDDQVLLLLRSSKHNDSTWGLPGGNMEKGDTTFQATAEREATEEMGLLPSYTITASILTKRGKHNSKHYTVFVAALSPEDAAAYQPQLNQEHSEARWWKWSDLVSTSAPDLHPVMKQLLKGSERKELSSALPMWGDVSLDKKHHEVEKRGSGLFLVNGHDAFFVRRNSSHNNDTWDVPGGNVDLADTHLEAAAQREAKEELGACPEYSKAGSIFTTRGKHDSKEFTIFIGFVTDEVRNSFAPVLSDESLDFDWLDVKRIAKAKDVHPRVEDLFTVTHYRRQLEEILNFDF